MPFDLDAIRSKLSISDVAQRIGIDLPRSGDAKCPRHGGKSLRLKADCWRCFGGCDKGGDIFDLVMFVRNCSFREAAEELAQTAGVDEILTPDDIRRFAQRRQSEDILFFAAEFYQKQYVGSPAEAYATQRSINLPEASLGYAPDEWEALVGALVKAGIDLTQAEQAGLIKQRPSGKGYYDHFRHCLIIPAYERGRCTYLQGRSLGPGETVKEDATHSIPKYKNTALDEPPLYHVNGALRGTTAIVSESTTDTLRLSAAGLSAVGTYGAALKPQQRQALARFEQIYVAVQNDEAGYKFADNLAAAFDERVIIAPPPAQYKDWFEALSNGEVWHVDERCSWFRWRLAQIDRSIDLATRSGKLALQPLLEYLAKLDDPALVALYLDELRQHFRWTRERARAYEKQIRQVAIDCQRKQIDAKRLPTDDQGTEVNLMADIQFLNPAQAYHNGIVYVSRQVVRKMAQQTKHGVETFDVYEPVIITSDRRVITVPEHDRNAPSSAVIYLDEAKTLALRSRPAQASHSWSYESLRAHIDGQAPTIEPHIIYSQLLKSLQSYVYFADSGDYIIATLWTMGTYFHQLFDAFPYLAIHGHKGSGKTTLLHWLQHVAFNASHLVNTSEASLFRWIEATAPTMLIDEQEGLGSRQAAKNDKADLMGILKAGYQKGAMVARQNMEEKTVTQQFSVYCPKALAAIEMFEDILEDRSILVYMHKPSDDQRFALNLKPRAVMSQAEFGPLRDSLYLLLMQSAANVDAARQQVKNAEQNRLGELVLPLLTMAAIVDYSRDRQRLVLDELMTSIARQSERRNQRDAMTPEAMLREAVELVIADAELMKHGSPMPGLYAQRMPDGSVVMDSLHIHEAFKSLFPSAKESYFRLDWLAKQVMKSDFIKPYEPEGHSGKRAYRWRREIQERNTDTGEKETTVKMLSVYITGSVSLTSSDTE